MLAGFFSEEAHNGLLLMGFIFLIKEVIGRVAIVAQRRLGARISSGFWKNSKCVSKLQVLYVFSTFTKKTLIFNYNLPPEDDVIGEI